MEKCILKLKAAHQFYTKNLLDIYVILQDFQVDVYFRQRWVDHRLAFDGQEAPVILSARSIEKIWVSNIAAHQFYTKNLVNGVYVNWVDHPVPDLLI